ncbi:hypothetical protein B9G53_23550 [Pseudanabaena sp. SR411]|uniref:hypothetical protein n=1 Tax=Pseudanabaena sp. SR411 TaxID=1980935 RepID=UPI000B99BD6C|nr:hypothetical protein [Pseudanabaena sp. SR411]OYQ62172.1 hypothetical protein B9G53_23550 [Pseudanabaena sp. SR411]
MSVSSYFQDLVIAVSRLEDYGLAKTITSNSESRPSGELFINIKVELIDNSVLFIREYISAKQEQNELSQMLHEQTGVLISRVTVDRKLKKLNITFKKNVASNRKRECKSPTAAI